MKFFTGLFSDPNKKELLLLLFLCSCSSPYILFKHSHAPQSSKLFLTCFARSFKILCCCCVCSFRMWLLDWFSFNAMQEPRRGEEKKQSSSSSGGGNNNNNNGITSNLYLIFILRVANNTPVHTAKQYTHTELGRPFLFLSLTKWQRVLLSSHSYNRQLFCVCVSFCFYLSVSVSVTAFDRVSVCVCMALQVVSRVHVCVCPFRISWTTFHSIFSLCLCTPLPPPSSSFSSSSSNLHVIGINACVHCTNEVFGQAQMHIKFVRKKKFQYWQRFCYVVVRWCCVYMSVCEHTRSSHECVCVYFECNCADADCTEQTRVYRFQ